MRDALFDLGDLFVGLSSQSVSRQTCNTHSLPSCLPARLHRLGRKIAFWRTRHDCLEKTLEEEVLLAATGEQDSRRIAYRMERMDVDKLWALVGVDATSRRMVL